MTFLENMLRKGAGAVLVSALGVLSAHGAPAAPAALVEDVMPAQAGVRSLDFVSVGQVIELGSVGKLTLGYLASCVQEQISGGRVTVGTQQSEVQNGQVARSKVECDGGRLVLAANQAVHSGAVAVRSHGPSGEPRVTVHDVSPLIVLPRAGRVVLKRVDVTGERHSIQVDEVPDQRVRLDLAEHDIRLMPGGTYMVSVGGLAQVVQVSAGAARGGVPLVGRLVPF